MNGRKWMWIGLMGLACPTGLFAQGPAGIAAAAGAVPPAAAAAAPADPTTLWSFLGISKKQLETCKQKKCQTPLGQLMSKSFMPVTMLSGGIIPPLCNGLPTPEELADKGAVGAAAAIKAEEAGAKARKAAIRYLGTVDCTRFPDAQDALVKGLRGDTNECVRFEAALALGNGCCCTKVTMEALSVAASCSDRDGMPREYSDRVRAAAVAALQRCLSCYVDPNPPKIDKPTEGKTEEDKKKDDTKAEELKKPQNADDVDGENKPAAKRPVGMEYYARILNVPKAQIIEEARRVVDKYNQTGSPAVVLNRQTSLFQMVAMSANDPMATTPTVVENGVAVPRAEVVSGRPQNLWDIMAKEAGLSPTATPRSVAEPSIRTSVEPPPVVVRSEPLPKLERSEPLPSLKPRSESKQEPLVITTPESPYAKGSSALSPPALIKPMNPDDVLASLGDSPTGRSRTPAELAGQGRGTGMNVITPGPNVAKEQLKPSDRVAMKPAEPTIELPKMKINEPALPSLSTPPKAPVVAKAPESPYPVITTPAPAKLAEPAKPAPIIVPAPTPVVSAPAAMPKTIDLPTPKSQVVEVAKPVMAPTALAQRALTVMTDPHPAAVREQVAGSLSAADLNSTPELLPVLIEAARSGNDEVTRKSAIRALVRCQANSAPVLSLMEKLTDDANPTIRVEAAIGLARLRVTK